MGIEFDIEIWTKLFYTLYPGKHHFAIVINTGMASDMSLCVEVGHMVIQGFLNSVLQLL